MYWSEKSKKLKGSSKTIALLKIIHQFPLWVNALPLLFSWMSSVCWDTQFEHRSLTHEAAWQEPRINQSPGSIWPIWLSRDFDCPTCTCHKVRPNISAEWTVISGLRLIRCCWLIFYNSSSDRSAGLQGINVLVLIIYSFYSKTLIRIYWTSMEGVSSVSIQQ